VRGTLYESPTFGYSLTWKAASWEVTSSLTEDRLDSLEMSGPEGFAWFWAFDYAGTEDACVDQAIVAVESSGIFDTFSPQFNDEGEPRRGLYLGALSSVVEARYTGTLDGVDYPVDVWCSHITETSMLEGVYIRYVSDPTEEWRDAFSELNKGLAPPASNWTPGQVTDPNDTSRPGLLEFGLTGDGDWETTEGMKHPRMDFTVTNVDTIPVVFDAGSLWLDDGLYKPSSYGWEDDPERTRQVVMIGPGKSVSGYLYYEVPAKTPFGMACYWTGDECVELGGCIFGGCGGGARPRLKVSG
jgi:hypothetical protein